MAMAAEEEMGGCKLTSMDTRTVRPEPPYLSVEFKWPISANDHTKFGEMVFPVITGHLYAHTTFG